MSINIVNASDHTVTNKYAHYKHCYEVFKHFILFLFLFVFIFFIVHSLSCLLYIFFFFAEFSSRTHGDYFHFKTADI